MLIKSSLLVQHFSWYILMTFLLMFSVILQSILWYYSTHLKTTLYNLWQQTELALEVESDSRDFVDLGRKWLVDFNTGKTLLVLFERSNKTGAFDVEIDRSFHEGKSSFKMLGLSFSSKLDWGSLHYLNCSHCLRQNWSLDLFYEVSDFALYLFKSTMQPCIEYYCHFRAGATSCYFEFLDEYKNGYVELLVLHLLPLLNPWKVASWNLLFSTLVDFHLNWFSWFHFLILVGVYSLSW